MQTSKQCQDFYSSLQPPLKDQLSLTCPDNDESSAAGVAASCSGIAITVGLSASKKITPAVSGWVAQKTPVLIQKIGTKVVPFLGVAGATLTAYSIGDFLLETLTAQDRACFENIEKKKAILEFQHTVSQHLLEKIQAAQPAIQLSEDQRRSLTFPPEYLNDAFIQNLPCERLKEIALIQKRKQDLILGPMIAKGQLKKDPRKEMALSKEEQDFTGYILENANCISPAKKMEIVCAIGSAAVGGHQLRKLFGMDALKRPARSVASPASASTASPAASASTITGEKEVLEKVNKNFPTLKLGAPVKSAEYKGTNYFDMEATDASGKRLGKMSYQVNTNDNSMKVDSTVVWDDADKGKGLSNMFMLKVLKEHPEIKVIRAETLQDDNLDKAWTTFKETKDCKKALMATAAYKSRARFGFSDIFDFDCSNPSDLKFSVRRP